MLMIGNFKNGILFSSNSLQFKKKNLLIVICFQRLQFKHNYIILIKKSFAVPTSPYAPGS
jgi:hypothetical protein